MNLRTLLVPLLVLAGCGAKPTDLAANIIGRCEYTGPQSKLAECKDYLGAWTASAAEKDCGELKGGYLGGGSCAPAESLGFCILAAKPEQNRTYIASNNTAKCAGARTGCELFGGGVWTPSGLCGGANDELVVTSDSAWKQPARKCFMPAAGEAPGKGPNGQVCVWETIHGSTEEGRSFRKDAECNNSRSGRPYYPKDPGPRVNDADPRRNDAAYLAEEAWVRSQINASSCVCCHASAAPAGASIFDIDREGSLANQFTDRGVAHGSGDVNTIPLGAFPPDMNNGFTKSDWSRPNDSIFLTTDPARMKRFWQKELEHRGLTAASFVGVEDGLGPLSEQLNFQPKACAGAEGIAADGTITWGKGKARYVYVMEADAKSPTVWPNLDMPAKTLWRLDVPATGTPLPSGSVKYGVVAEGLSQKFPASGSPAALVSGRQYFLYVSADQLMPITRCLITAP